MKKQHNQKLESGEGKPQKHEVNHHYNGSNHRLSLYIQYRWDVSSGNEPQPTFEPINGGSFVRDEGRVYSLAASNGFIFSGSTSKYISVRSPQNTSPGFKSGSGIVKAIVVSGGRIFSGHQDGKIRVWNMKNPDKVNDAVSVKRSGTIPSLKEEMKTSVNPKNYVKVRRKKRVLKIKHYDTVSCMSVAKRDVILYSGSWDKTVKVWSLSNGDRFLESIEAHEDAVNTVATGFESMVFTGSADGTVKAWSREFEEKKTKHRLVRTLLRGPHSVTAIVVDSEAGMVYAGTSEGLIHVWMKEKGFEHVGVLRAHSIAVLCLAAVRGIVFSGGADGIVCVWRRSGNGCHVLGSVLGEHCGPVKCVAVEKTEYGCLVYSGSLDRSIRVWTVFCDNPGIV